MALAETNQSTTDTEVKKELDSSVIARISILSCIFVAVSLLLGHFMDDHDKYGKRLIEFQDYYKSYEESDKCFNFLKNGNNSKKDILHDYYLFRVTLMHFGHIDFTVIGCFLSVTVILTWLIIEFWNISTFGQMDIIIIAALILILILINGILISQLWIFSRQGNMIARCIKRLQDINLEGELKKVLEKELNLETCKDAEKTFPYKIFTLPRLLIARKDYYTRRDFYTDLLVCVFILFLFFITLCGLNLIF